MTTDTAKTFAIGSCQYPGSFFDQEYAYQAWQKLSDDSGLCKADTLLLLGDQIYVDATAGLFDESDFRKKYLYAYEALHSRINEATIPKTKYSLNDDHELNENWEPIFSGSGSHSENEEIIKQGLSVNPAANNSDYADATTCRSSSAVCPSGQFPGLGFWQWIVTFCTGYGRLSGRSADIFVHAQSESLFLPEHSGHSVYCGFVVLRQERQAARGA